jgi:hypothetical protein
MMLLNRLNPRNLFHVIQKQSNYILVKRYLAEESIDRAGSCQNASDLAEAGADCFWDGTRWVYELDLAMRFATKTLAQQYLARNSRDM